MTVVTGMFPSRVLATFIRIRPLGCFGNCCMRFELIGCPGMLLVSFKCVEGGVKGMVWWM